MRGPENWATTPFLGASPKAIETVPCIRRALLLMVLRHNAFLPRGAGRGPNSLGACPKEKANHPSRPPHGGRGTRCGGESADGLEEAVFEEEVAAILIAPCLAEVALCGTAVDLLGIAEGKATLEGGHALRDTPAGYKLPVLV